MCGGGRPGRNGVEHGVAIAVMPDGFSAHGILLVSEGESCVAGAVHVMQRALVGKDVPSGWRGEGDVLEPEGLAPAVLKQSHPGHHWEYHFQKCSLLHPGQFPQLSSVDGK